MPGPGQIQTQPNAIINSADKQFSLLLGNIAATVTAIATLISTGS